MRLPPAVALPRPDPPASRDFRFLPTSDDFAPSPRNDHLDDNLTPAKRLAVAQIVAGRRFVAVARAAGVTDRTLRTWRQEPAFARAVERASQMVLQRVAAEVREEMLRATRALDLAMDRPRDGPRHAFRILDSERLWQAACVDISSGVAGD